MAYIYSKNSGHCLILGFQEAINYPFNFGNFQEIRLGMFLSLVSGGSGNFNSMFSAVTGYTTGPNTQFFIGFKDSGAALPGTPGSTFVGVAKNQSDLQYSIAQNALNFGYPSTYGNFVTTDTQGNQIYFAGNQNSITLGNPILDTGFASFWGISLGIVNNTFSGMVIYDTAVYSDISTGNLSKLVNSPPLTSNFITGFFTTGALGNFNNLIIPQSVYIYFSLPNNQLRIHSLDLEQFN